jgi:hypothetical protein
MICRGTVEEKLLELQVSLFIPNGIVTETSLGIEEKNL